MLMPSKRDQIINLKSKMKNSLSEIMSAYRKNDWVKINSLTALFPNTPYSPTDEYISPNIKIPAKLKTLIDNISYATQTKKTVKSNHNELDKLLFPNLIAEAKAEKLM